MSLELLDEPTVQVKDGTTYHIYAIDTIDDASVREEAEKTEPALPKAVGYVALTQGLMERYLENDQRPYMIHDTMIVQGAVGTSRVYDKTISPRAFMGLPKPFYGIRISIAKRRATHRVLATLT
jgi:hypothetical protein